MINGTTMIHAYNESYLGEVMPNLGAMLDYAINSCGEEIGLFYERFLSCGISEQIERGNPRYLAGLSGVELAMTVASRSGSPLKDAEPLIDMGSPEYWTGWTLAYIHWYLGKSFKYLKRAGIEPKTLLAKYPTLHEADLSKSVSFAQKELAQYLSQNNPLKTQRKIAGITQTELAERSGISLRAIRAYEQSQLKLSTAGAESVYHLAMVLGCDLRDLVE